VDFLLKGKVDTPVLLKPCMTPEGLLWLHITLLKAAWRTLKAKRKGLQRWNKTI